jgi:hypothetical protein
MARHRKIPKRLPPVTKEIQKAMQSLTNYLGTIAKFEKDSIALDNARLAIAPEQEKKEPKQTELTPGTDTNPAPEKKKRKKKDIDLSRTPGENDATNISSE